MSENRRSAMARKVIISCAVTGGSDTVGKHPAIPVTPEQIAKAAVYDRKAGAAVAHIHVRNPETGKLSMAFELYEEVVQRIRDSGSEVRVNTTTDEGGLCLTAEERSASRWSARN